MENPSNWTETQKVINNAMWNDTTRDRNETPGKNIVAALKENGLLKNEEPEFDGEKIDLAATIDLELQLARDAAAEGFCGISGATRIYHKLQELGAI